MQLGLKHLHSAMGTDHNLEYISCASLSYVPIMTQFR